MSKNCPHCSKPGPMTPDEFRSRFKVGDWISGWGAPPVVILITGLGEGRFLYKRFDSHGRDGRKEFVAAMRAYPYVRAPIENTTDDA